jgi:hypothetical protein
MAQMVECLPSKCEALSSIRSTGKKKRLLIGDWNNRELANKS